MRSDLAIGIDLGGTRLRAAVVDQHGNVLRRSACNTDAAGGPLAIVEQMLALVHEAAAGDMNGIATLGIAAPGPLDSETGTIISIPTLPGWVDVPLRNILSQRLRLPTILENDGIAAAYGEWKHGAGQGLRNLVYVTVSTGIGGGVVADGKLLHGRRGMAGHVGHMMIAADGPRCACGGTGCFEALASGTALGSKARQAGYADAKTMTQAARSGDAKALELIRQEAEILGFGFASLIHLYSPDRLIVGGGVSSAMDMMAPVIRKRIESLVMAPFRAAGLVAAELGDNAGLVGAAALSGETGG